MEANRLSMVYLDNLAPFAIRQLIRDPLRAPPSSFASEGRPERASHRSVSRPKGGDGGGRCGVAAGSLRRRPDAPAPHPPAEPSHHHRMPLFPRRLTETIDRVLALVRPVPTEGGAGVCMVFDIYIYIYIYIYIHMYIVISWRHPASVINNSPAFGR